MVYLVGEEGLVDGVNVDDRGWEAFRVNTSRSYVKIYIPGRDD